VPSIVQFFHSGIEHSYDSFSKNNKYYKEWNKGEHKRKFIINNGSYIENNKKYEGKMLFWCEWEPPSLVEKIIIPDKKNPYEEYPEYLHYPFLPNKEKREKYQEENYQNTDPFVFGENFRYAICRQDSRPVLKDLEKGSVIIFGSRVNSRFAMDTIFVVNESKKYTSALDKKLDSFGLYTEIVLRMACNEKLLVDKINRTLYLGATFENPVENMFSFVPAKKYEANKQGFSRIVMPNEFYEEKNNRINKYFSSWRKNYKNNPIYEGKNMGIKETYTTIDEVKYFWNYLAEFISKDFILGYNFEMPIEVE
jgi:hypothetical protein